MTANRAVANRTMGNRTMRLLALVTLINSTGTGAFLAITVLYLTSQAGISSTQVGIGLAVGGICGIIAGLPTGALADRWGSRRTLTLLWVLDGALMLGYLWIHSFGAFVPLICVLTFVDRGATGVRGAVIVQAAVKEDEAIRARAFLRAVMNAGLGIGAILAGFALEVNSRQAYAIVIVLNAVSFLVAAGLLKGVKLHPRTQQDEAAGKGPGPASPGVLRDIRYLVITVLYGILSIQFGILYIGLPLWIVGFTHAPRWMISATLTLSTVLVVILQVQASRGTERPRRAVWACGVSGLFLALGCGIYAASAGSSTTTAVVLLLVGTVAITVGEVLSSAGAWALSYLLADPAATGKYQGVFNSGFSGGMLVSGLVLTNTVIRFGAPGWLMLAALFAGAGLGFAVPIGAHNRIYRPRSLP